MRMLGFTDEYLLTIDWMRTAVKNYQPKTADPAIRLHVVAITDHIAAWVQCSTDCNNKDTTGL